jgi:hypothetical protein
MRLTAIEIWGRANSVEIKVPTNVQGSVLGVLVLNCGASFVIKATR